MVQVPRLFRRFMPQLIHMFVLPLFYFAFVLLYHPFELQQHFGTEWFGVHVTVLSCIIFISTVFTRLLYYFLPLRLNYSLYSLWCFGEVFFVSFQCTTANRELQRVESLLGDGAATSKQRDDIQSQINVLQDQLSATLSTLDKNTSSINNNATALEAQIAALDDLLSKCRIISPINGTVLVKYAQAGELAAMGKPLMKVADLSQIYLRAYFTSDQLAHLNLGNEVTVTADFGADQRYDYKGKVVWISSESEFTPKTIQTKDTRANLVYAVKIAVKNDGRLKVGLAGEVKL